MAQVNEFMQQTGQPEQRIAGCHAIVLSGGASRRMGERKELLQIAGEPLLLRLCRSLSEAAEEVTVVADRERSYDFLPSHVRIAVDQVADYGPIAGICAGMTNSRLPLQLVVACDYPLTSPRIWTELAQLLTSHPEVDTVVPEAGGKLHPLCAIYRSTTLPVWEAALRSGNRRVMEAMQAMRMLAWRPEAAGAAGLMNMNTPEDFRLAKERLGEC
ncbi:molybdenum cofactor guanylyltransferase [Cohnella sp. 56]|uniref:molybdenum cofactor guanylyltransferase n=1 Tax=Cohnella sp. 56 TaxID=3113722 RepID=UPI0030EA372C